MAASLVRGEPASAVVSASSHSAPAAGLRNSTSLLGSSEGFAFVPNLKLDNDFLANAPHAPTLWSARFTPGDPDRPLAQAPRVTFESAPFTSLSPSKL